MQNARPEKASTNSSSSELIDFVSAEAVGVRARRGALWSVLQILLRNGIAICTTAVLARLLSPDDYGLTGMVATLTAALLVFSDMGLSWATVQRKDLTKAQVHNLFWLNAAAGLILWLVCIASAPVVAAFYGRPELMAITAGMGATFLLSGLAVQPVALLIRAMQFRTLATVEVTAVIGGALVAIATALYGGGYWALVAQGIASQLVRMILTLVICRWQLRRPVFGVGTRHLVGFGGLLALNGAMIYFARNLDNVLIGRFWGAEELGLYNRAYFLMLLPSTLANGVLTGLMVPSLSALQSELHRFGQAYRRSVRIVAYFGTPMALGLALTAYPAVRLIYGEAWLPVVPLLTWLSIAGITQPIYNTTGWLFTATGHVKAYLWLTISNSIVLGTVFFAAVQHGTVAVAAGYGLAMGLLIPVPALWFAHRAAQLPFGPTLRILAPVMGLNTLMAAAVFAVGKIAEAIGVGWQTVFSLQVLVGMLTYLAGTKLLIGDMLRDDILRILPAWVRERVA